MYLKHIYACQNGYKEKQLIQSLKQVWKDVDGVLTCDPNIYPKAEPVPFLTFDEAAELAYFGAQVSLQNLHSLIHMEHFTFEKLPYAFSMV